jgi:NCS1 family nucleobase:cation symporter-1
VTQQKTNIQLTNWEIVSVNPADKQWNWKTLFCFWGNSIQSIIGFSLIASLYLVYDLNFLVVLAGSLIGSIFVYFLCNLIGKPSQRHGIPFPVLLRTSLGIRGAKYVSLLRGLVGIFMFGVQTFFISKSLGYLIRIAIHSYDQSMMNEEIFLTFFFAMNIIDWSAFFLALIIQILLFSKGHNFNKSFINFSALFVYLGLIIFLVIVVSEYSLSLSKSFKDLLVYENIFSKENIVPISTIAGTIFAYFSIVIVNFGDFSRYVKNEKELNLGNLSLLLNLVIFSLLSVLVVMGCDIILKNNLVDIDRILTNPTDIIGKFNNTFLTIIVIFFILFASASTNLIANYIPTQNSLLNFLPKSLNIKSAAIIIALFGLAIGASWTPVLSQVGILSIVDTIGSFFGPIFGIVVTDYYLINKSKINNKDLYSSMSNGSYFFSNGWHIKGIYALIIGFIFSACTIWNINLSFLQSYSWLIGAIMSSITYYFLLYR